ncbi:hypothetical protein NA57DRAFT_64665 [Rhizodiscina lignyota]|uniref:Ribosome quality control complex subunit 2 n=1 Tax=Rhizodiscina lignyota TaxID=1504668 RepID=A0A9P4M8V8_9PEZI|nr:hypothetical protein NA57DRAFT_64665 [Rhizodiscina lignyota]
MKQRFSSLDVKVIAHELNATLPSLRVTNIYDLSTRIFLIKFHAPNQREQLVIDSGFRCHLSSFARTTAAAPSPFVQRLRKFLKTRRVTKVAQIGTDRIIELQFSDGLYRLFLEFYAAGNIVLTDAELNVIALQRIVSEGDEQVKLGAKYNLEGRQNYAGVPELTRESVVERLKAAVAKQSEATQDDGAKKAKFKKKGKDALRKTLAVSLTEYPPMLLDHGLSVVGFDKETSPEEVIEKDSVMEKLMEALQEARRIIDEVMAASIVKGYILAKPLKKSEQEKEANKESGEGSDTTSNLIYDDFHPFKPHQFESDPSIRFLEFEGFNKTVDEFFSSIEGQRLESRLHEREEAAKRKLDQARADHEKRIDSLQQVQVSNVRKAQAIEANLERVEEAKAAVNGLIGQGMDWADIARLIETEQKRGNQVAQMIKLPLKLYENTVTLLLAEPSFDEDPDDEGYETETHSSDSEDELPTTTKGKELAAKEEDKRLTVDIDLGLSSWTNASQYYDQKKSAVKKEEKTAQASGKALKSAQLKIQADLKKGLKQEKDVLRPVRKQFWFEKFLYFISSEGYLVLGGKDAPQNELLYRKHLRKGDVYVHADLHGASSVIIKNNPATPDAPIPPSTLSQAGNLSVCTSSAWDSKAVMSAWWVNADQVSKTAPTGEYLTTGGFMIRGQKNFLPPAQLLLGFAVMFQISEDSKSRHIKHRILDSDPTVLGAAEAKPPEPAEEAAPEPEPEPEPAAPTQDSDEEEDFPDVKVTGLSIDSDEDEDFPDAKLDDSNPEAEDEEEGTATYNPLQEGTSEAKENEDDVADPTKGAEKAQSSENAADEKSQKGTRHLSAKERRLLRKGITSSQQPSTAASESDPEPRDTRPSAPSPAPTSSSASKGKPQPVPRGKRGKQKKLAAKYADQDEEDRELAMRILGSKTGQEQAKAEAEARKKKKEEEEAQKQRRREQHQRVQAAAEEKRRRAVDGAARAEGAPEDDADETLENDEEAARLEAVGLDAFVGRPLPGDELLAAIPMCAPWQALANYKYKVKMQPGMQKRGKALREILGRWDADAKVGRNVDEKSEDGEKMWPREIELVRAWKEAEVVGVLPVGKLRVMLSGGGGGKDGGKGKGKAQAKGKGGKGGKK